MGERAVCGGRSLILWESDAQITGSTFRGGGELTVDGFGDVLFEGNLLEDGPQLFIPGAGDGSVFRGNTIRNTVDRAIGVYTTSAPTFEGNVIEGAGGDGFTVGFENATSVDPVIRDNRVVDSGAGIRVRGGSAAQVSGNELEDNRLGIEVQSDRATLTDNVLDGNELGISVINSPALEGNTVGGAQVGLRLAGPNTAPSMSGNVICDNEQDLVLAGRAAAPPQDDSNEICGEPVTE